MSFLALYADIGENKKGDPIAGRPFKGNQFLLARFRRHFRVIPTVNTGGHVLDVGVTQILCRHGRLRIGWTLGVATIGDDQRVLIRGQLGCQIRLDGGPTQCAWHVTGLVRIGAIGVNDHSGFGIGRRFDVGDADVGKFAAGVNGDGKQRCCH
jgi:hypothetical protein